MHQLNSYFGVKQTSVSMTAMNKKLIALCLFAIMGTAQADAQELLTLPDEASPEIREKFGDGIELLNSGKAAEAVEKLSDVTRALPNYAAGHVTYGMALEESGKTSEAVSEYESAARLSPDDEKVLFYLGRIYQMTGQRDNAILYWDRYLWLYPEARHATYVKGALELMKKEKNTSSVFADSKGKDNYLDETLSKGAARWSKNRMPIPVYIKSGAGVSGYKANYDLLLRQAFADWESASQGKVSFRPVNTLEESLIDCSWTSNPDDFANKTEAGETRCSLAGEKLAHASIFLLTKSMDGGAAIGLKGTCLHEIGHAIGLKGHSSADSDIMFMMSKNTSDSNTALSDRDKRTVIALYSISDADMASYNRFVRRDKQFLHNASSDYDRARAFFEDGEAAFNSRKFLEAAQAWERAAEIQPDTVAYKIDLGHAYLNLAQQEIKANKLTSAKQHLDLAAKNYKSGHRRELAVIAYTALIQIAHLLKNENDERKYQAELAKVKQTAK